MTAGTARHQHRRATGADTSRARFEPLVQGRTLTVCYHGWDHERTVEKGFKDPDRNAGWNQEKKP